MKRAVSISLGSSKRDKKVEITLKGEKILVGRIGMDGGIEKIKQLYAELDGKIDAFGALHVAHERQLGVGKENAITGLDGVQSAQFTELLSSTLAIPVYDIARHLVALLVDSRRNKTSAHPHITIQPKLLVRDLA